MDPRCSTPAIPSSGGGRFVAAGRSAFATVVIAAVVALTGCTSGPEPKPTPTPLFASDAEAFKAAEQVYRDYVDAGNAQQNGDTSADPQKHLAGVALDDDIESLREFEKSGLSVTGISTVRRFRGKEYDSTSSEVQALTCLDVSQSRVVNADGVDVTPAGRPTMVGLSVEFAPDRGGLKIMSIEPDEEPCR